MPALIVQTGPETGRRLEVESQHTIGRENQELTITDVEVSRSHAVVRATSTGLEIEDNGSSNGTFVNGERISGARGLNDGDQVRLGQTILLVEAPRSQATVIRATPPVDEGATVVRDAPVVEPPLAQPPVEPQPPAAQPPAPEQPAPAAQPPPLEQPAPAAQPPPPEQPAVQSEPPPGTPGSWGYPGEAAAEEHPLDAPESESPPQQAPEPGDYAAPQPDFVAEAGPQADAPSSPQPGAPESPPQYPPPAAPGYVIGEQSGYVIGEQSGYGTAQQPGYDTGPQPVGSGATGEYAPPAASPGYGSPAEKSKLWLWILLGVIVAALIAFAIFFFLGSNKLDSAEVESAISQDIKAAGHEFSGIECPSDIPKKEGEQITCKLTGVPEGQPTAVTYEEDAGGDLNFVAFETQ